MIIKKVNTIIILKNQPNHKIHTSTSTSTSSKTVILSCLFLGNSMKDINIIYQEQLSVSILHFVICIQYIIITSRRDHYCSVFIHTVQQIGLLPFLVNDVDGDNTKNVDI